jgi:hypothetical protein
MRIYLALYSFSAPHIPSKLCFLYFCPSLNYMVFHSCFLAASVPHGSNCRKAIFYVGVFSLFSACLPRKTQNKKEMMMRLKWGGMNAAHNIPGNLSHHHVPTPAPSRCWQQVHVTRLPIYQLENPWYAASICVSSSQQCTLSPKAIFPNGFAWEASDVSKQAVAQLLRSEYVAAGSQL